VTWPSSAFCLGGLLWDEKARRALERGVRQVEVKRCCKAAGGGGWYGHMGPVHKTRDCCQRTLEPSIQGRVRRYCGFHPRVDWDTAGAAEPFPNARGW
jgi:hypothetical protein